MLKSFSILVFFILGFAGVLVPIHHHKPIVFPLIGLAIFAIGLALQFVKDQKAR